MEPKDLRTLRRPLNVVAMRAPLSSDCLGGTYPKTRQSAVGYRGICPFIIYSGPAMPLRLSGTRNRHRHDKRQKPHGKSHEVYGTLACLRHQNCHISANWRRNPFNRLGESSRRDEVTGW